MEKFRLNLGGLDLDAQQTADFSGGGGVDLGDGNIARLDRDSSDVSGAQSITRNVAVLFRNAVFTDDLELATALAHGPFRDEITAELLVELRAAWSSQDEESWGWATAPRPVGLNREVVLYVRSGQPVGTDEAGDRLVESSPFHVELVEGVWRLIGLQSA